MTEESAEVKTAGLSSPRSPQSNGGGSGDVGVGVVGSGVVGGGGVKPSSPPSPAGQQGPSQSRQLRRVKLTEQQLESLAREDLALKWREQDLYVEYLEAQTSAQEGTEIT